MDDDKTAAVATWTMPMGSEPGWKFLSDWEPFVEQMSDEVKKFPDFLFQVNSISSFF